MGKYVSALEKLLQMFWFRTRLKFILRGNACLWEDWLYVGRNSSRKWRLRRGKHKTAQYSQSILCWGGRWLKLLVGFLWGIVVNWLKFLPSTNGESLAFVQRAPECSGLSEDAGANQCSYGLSVVSFCKCWKAFRAYLCFEVFPASGY